MKTKKRCISLKLFKFLQSGIPIKVKYRNSEFTMDKRLFFDEFIHEQLLEFVHQNIKDFDNLILKLPYEKLMQKELSVLSHLNFIVGDFDFKWKYDMETYNTSIVLVESEKNLNIMSNFLWSRQIDNYISSQRKD